MHPTLKRPTFLPQRLIKIWTRQPKAGSCLNDAAAPTAGLHTQRKTITKNIAFQRTLLVVLILLVPKHVFPSYCDGQKSIHASDYFAWHCPIRDGILVIVSYNAAQEHLQASTKKNFRMIARHGCQHGASE